MAITADSLPENPNKTQATVGKDYFLKVNTGTYESPTWTLVGGQRNSKLGKKADSIDVSDKTTGGWSSKMPGLKSWTIDLSGLVMLNDDGVDALNAAFDASKMVDVSSSIQTRRTSAVGQPLRSLTWITHTMAQRLSRANWRAMAL